MGLGEGGQHRLFYLIILGLLVLGRIWLDRPIMLDDSFRYRSAAVGFLQGEYAPVQRGLAYQWDSPLYPILIAMSTVFFGDTILSLHVPIIFSDILLFFAFFALALRFLKDDLFAFFSVVVLLLLVPPWLNAPLSLAVNLSLFVAVLLFHQKVLESPRQFPIFAVLVGAFMFTRPENLLIGGILLLYSVIELRKRNSGFPFSIHALLGYLVIFVLIAVFIHFYWSQFIVPNRSDVYLTDAHPIYTHRDIFYNAFAFVGFLAVFLFNSSFLFLLALLGWGQSRKSPMFSLSIVLVTLYWVIVSKFSIDHFDLVRYITPTIPLFVLMLGSGVNTFYNLANNSRHKWLFLLLFAVLLDFALYQLFPKYLLFNSLLLLLYVAFALVVKAPSFISGPAISLSLFLLVGWFALVGAFHADKMLYAYTQSANLDAFISHDTRVSQFSQFEANNAATTEEIAKRVEVSPVHAPNQIIYNYLGLAGFVAGFFLSTSLKKNKRVAH